MTNAGAEADRNSEGESSTSSGLTDSADSAAGDDPEPVSDGGYAAIPDSLENLASGIRFGQFASVGVVGAVFDNTVLTILNLGTNLPTIAAKAAGIETAIVVMFLVNEHWTFSDEGAKGRRPFFRRMLRSHLVRMGGVSVQLVLFTLLYYGVDVSVPVAGIDFWFLVASLVAIGIAMFVNYLFESLFTWRVHEN